MKKLFVFILLFVFVSKYIIADDNIDNSVAKVYTTSYINDWENPWRPPNIHNFTGSCCIIEGNKIITNAHNVTNAILIQLKKAGDDKKYTAQLEHIVHECDLALLSVEDPSFFENTIPLKIGEDPKRQDTVTAHGFPMGGDEISLTQGIISRIESQEYAPHSKAKLLITQIDAAINPGNSGGPVVKDGKVVGIAFQVLRGGKAEGLGYIIPPTIINHFLKDCQLKKGKGFPSLLISWQDIENEALRNSFGISKDESGILVNSTSFNSPAKNILQKQDIIMSINGTKIANDGTIPFDENTRTSWTDLISNRFIGEELKLKILRDKKPINVKIPLTKKMFADRLVPYNQYDIRPSYYIFAGLLFQPINGNILNEYQYVNLGNLPILYNSQIGKITKNRKQLVVLTRVLPHKINKGYDKNSYNNLIIKEINGTKIGSIKDVISAIENNNKKYHTIISDEGKLIVIDNEEAKLANPEILKNYLIPSDRSNDLQSK